MNSFLKRLDIILWFSWLYHWPFLLFFVASIRRVTLCSRNSRWLPVRLFHGWYWNYIHTSLHYPPDKRFFSECDAALIATSHSYEDASLLQMKSHFKSRLPIYSIGPLLPPGYSRHSVESSESKKGQMERNVQVFLDGMQAKYGERSVFFVGFFP